MSSSVTLVFPHQLSAENGSLSSHRPVFLIEEYLFFKQYWFHKQKLVFHRASMKFFESHLLAKRFQVTYIESNNTLSNSTALMSQLASNGTKEIHYCDTTDDWLEKRIRRSAEKMNIKLTRYDSPLFVLSSQQMHDYFDNKKRFYQTEFYIRQRKEFKILVDKELNPIGGKWTYDQDNRKKYPKGKQPPAVEFPVRNNYWKEAVEYVSKNFSNNYGETSEHFIYPVTFDESKKWLRQFLQVRFHEFGLYEDAILANQAVLHHSVLSTLLNVGLLSPTEVIADTVSFATENDVPINSTEGFVRQILGWREFIRGVYEHKGAEERTKNFWKFSRKIPRSFWHGTTGIAPVDITIKKITNTGYCHHIERLMVLGNFMLLCEFDPDEVYRWFMELFIDAYDWVMVPNVYGMSQFADGGLMSTKPYISGSNYLVKMSDYPEGEWKQIWDALFWRFIHLHREFFLKNPRLSMMVKTWEKMPNAKKESLLKAAEQYLQSLA